MFQRQTKPQAWLSRPLIGLNFTSPAPAPGRGGGQCVVFLRSVPLTWLLDVLVGQLGFVALPPFTVLPMAMLA